MKEVEVNIRTLAELARLAVTDEEVAKLEQEIPSILAFVETIQTASATGDKKAESGIRNVLRADENPHEAGKYTGVLLKAAPANDGKRVVVKQVVSRKNN